MLQCIRWLLGSQYGAPETAGLSWRPFVSIATSHRGNGNTHLLLTFPPARLVPFTAHPVHGSLVGSGGGSMGIIHHDPEFLRRPL